MATDSNTRRPSLSDFKPPDLLTPPTTPKGRTRGEIVSDTLRGVAKGASDLVNFGAQVPNLITSGAVDEYIVRPGQRLASRALGGPNTDSGGLAGAGAQIREGIASGYSPVLKAEQQKLEQADGWLSKAATVATSPTLLGQFGAEQVPNLLTLGAGTAGTAARATGAAAARGAAPAAAQAAGRAAAERQLIGFNAAQGGGASGGSAMQDAMSQPQEVWDANPDYQALIRGGTAPEQAKQQLALKAGQIAGAVAAPISGLAGAITAPLEASIFTRTLGGGVPQLLSREGAGIVARGVGKEAAEEAIQEGGEQFGQNVGIRSAVDPTRDLSQDVAENAAVGGVLGGILGGGLTAGGLAVSRPPLQDSPRQPQAEPQPAPARPQPPSVAEQEQQLRTAVAMAQTPEQQQTAVAELATFLEQQGRLIEPPQTAVVDSQGNVQPNAPTPPQLFDAPRIKLGSVPGGVGSVQQVPRGQPAAPRTPFPDAAPGTLQDAVNAIAEAAPAAPAAPTLAAPLLRPGESFNPETGEIAPRQKTEAELVQQQLEQAIRGSTADLLPPAMAKRDRFKQEKAARKAEPVQQPELALAEPEAQPQAATPATVEPETNSAPAAAAPEAAPEAPTEEQSDGRGGSAVPLAEGGAASVEPVRPAGEGTADPADGNREPAAQPPAGAPAAAADQDRAPEVNPAAAGQAAITNEEQRDVPNQEQGSGAQQVERPAEADQGTAQEGGEEVGGRDRRVLAPEAVTKERKRLGLPRVIRKVDAVAALRRAGLKKAEAEREFNSLERQGLKEGTRLGDDVTALIMARKQPAASAPAPEEVVENARLPSGTGSETAPVAQPVAEQTAAAGEPAAKPEKLPKRGAADRKAITERGIKPGMRVAYEGPNGRVEGVVFTLDRSGAEAEVNGVWVRGLKLEPVDVSPRAEIERAKQRLFTARRQLAELGDPALDSDNTRLKRQLRAEGVAKIEREIRDLRAHAFDEPASPEAPAVEAAAAEAKAKPAQAAAQQVSANTIFTEDAAAAARARLKAKLSRLGSGIDPEMLLDGITLAGYHIERGARTFAAYSKAMVSDLGDAVKPFLKSWYLAIRMDPRAAGFDGMDSLASVEAAEIASDEVAPATGESDAVRAVEGASPAALEGAPAADVPRAAGAEPAADGTDAGRGADADRPGADAGGGSGLAPGVGDRAGAVSVPAAGERRARGARGKPRVRRDAGAEQGAVDGDRTGDLIEAAQAAGQPGLLAPEPPQIPATDFTITDELELGEGGQKTKYRRNVEAIRLLERLQAEGRNATPEEQRTLALYVGWGGLAQAFDADNEKWSSEFAELKQLLSEEEYEAARQSTQYAHYTSREIINGIYAGMQRMGFTGGRVLEAGGGVGNFIGLMPEAMRSGGRFTLVERERIAAGIARALYPRQNVQMADFREFGKGDDGHFDAVIGNPPFARTTLTDLSGRKHLSGLRIHNYFIAKSIDLLRPGGLLVNVVSNGFMDAKDDRARRYIAERAELVAAIRLPNDAFKGNAHTEVTTDIVIFRKLPESDWASRKTMDAAKAWLGTTTMPDPAGGEAVPINTYFQRNPGMLLGEWGRYGTMRGPDQPALRSRAGQDTGRELARVMQQLPESLFESVAVQRTASMTEAQTIALQNPPVSEGGHFIQDGKLIQRVQNVAGETLGREINADTQWTEKTKLGEKGYRRLRQLAELRQTVRDLLAAELADDARMDELRTQLNTQYDAFAKDGLLNDTSTTRLFGDDPDYPLLASLELDYKPGMGAAAAKTAGVKPFASSAKKAAIFERRVIPVRREVEKASSPQDALNISLAERGRLDSAYIGKLLGRDSAEVLKELASGTDPLLYLDPATGEYVLRDAYLSGNVRKKLEQARAAGMVNNAEALEAVLPQDVGAADIAVRVGAPWVPPAVYEGFAKQLLGDGTVANLRYIAFDSSFSGDIVAGSQVAEVNTYGTPDYPASKLLLAILNNREVKVLRRDSEGKTYVDQEATEAAKDKAKDIRAKFQDWAFADSDRAERLVRAYNDANNNYVTRKYDGSWLTFPGKVPDEVIKFRRHQRNFVARVVQDRTALADHVVGAGKTYSAIAAAMELKRTGLANKPMIAVPNHLVKQWAADFYRLYPGANILTATKKDFERANRRRFLAKIAQNDWDAVIIAHSSFGFIRPAPEFEEAFIGAETNELRKLLNELKLSEDKADKRKVKQIEQSLEALDNRLKSLRDKPMDDLLDLEQLGVDQLFVDEAHLFKNLMFSTKMQNIRGLGDSKGSQRAYDMLIKTRQIMAKNGRDQGLVFLTGTPVSNSLAEMYHMMRYLMPTAMKEAGFNNFDAWANTFAEIEETLKPTTAGGYKTVTAFENFFNVFELLQVFDQVSDTVTMDDIKAAFREENGGREFPLPVLKSGRRQPVAMDMSPSQRAYMEEIGKRAETLEQRKGPPKKGEDNHLSLMSDARKAAMDVRLVDPSVTEREPGARIDRAASEIFERWQRWGKQKGAQLVFSDLGTPLKTVKRELAEYQELASAAAALENEDVQRRAELGDESALDLLEQAEAAAAKIAENGPDWLDAMRAAERGFSVYDDLRAALIERGIPAEQIAFIHDFNTDAQKATLFKKVNDGDIRVVLGSTPKMGAGTNVQKRLVALHHLDIPWKPSDVEQREGRIIRQGNLLADTLPDFEVEILAYVTKDTLDKNMWDIQERKIRGINQLRSRQISREIENSFDEMEMSASEMQAAATGNTDLLREIQLRNDITKLERKGRSYQAQQAEAVQAKRKAQDTLKTVPAKIEREERWNDLAAKYDRTTGLPKGWTIEIGGKQFNDPAAARAEALRLDQERITDKDGKDKAKPLDVTVDGVRFTGRQPFSDAVLDKVGDKDPVRWEIDGQTFTRRNRIANRVAELITSALAEKQDDVEVGKLGDFEVRVDLGGNQWTMTVAAPGAGERQTTVYVDTDDQGQPKLTEPLRLARALAEAAPNMVGGSRVDALRRSLATAERTLKDLADKDTSAPWPDQPKLDALRAEHKEIIQRIKKAKEEAAAARAAAQGVQTTPADEPPAQFSLFESAPGVGTAPSQIEAAIAGVIRGWNADTAPRVRVLADPEGLPARAKRDPRYRRAEGFYDQASGTVYLVASNLPTERRALQVLAHEAIGHYGMEAITGPELWSELEASVARLEQTASGKVRAALDSARRRYAGADRSTFTKEAIAVMAEQGLQTSLMARVVAAVRRFLRGLGFDLRLSESDVLAMIRDSARYLRRGQPAAGQPVTGAAFARPDLDPKARVPMVEATANRFGPTSTEEQRTAAREAAAEFLKEARAGGPYTNADSGLKLSLSATGNRELMAWTADTSKLDLLSVLPQIAEQSLLAKVEAGRENDRTRFATFYAPVQVGQQVRIARMVAREAGNGVFVYDLQQSALLETRNPEGSSGDVPATKAGASGERSGPRVMTVAELRAAVNADPREAWNWSLAVRGRTADNRQMISSITEMLQVAAEHGGEVFVRWSSGPAEDLKAGAKSRDYVSGAMHNGLSAVPITSVMSPARAAKFLKEYGFLRMRGEVAPHVYSGVRVGEDSDGYPSIRPIAHLGQLSAQLVKDLDRGLARRIELEEEIRDGEQRLDRITDVVGREIVSTAVKKARAELALLNASENQPAFSLAAEALPGLTVPERTTAAGVLRTMAEQGGLFRYPPSRATGLAQVFEEVTQGEVSATFKGETLANFTEDLDDMAEVQKWELRTTDGRPMFVYIEIGGENRMYVDASPGKSGQSMGSAVYAALFQYALNDGKVLIGDPNGLSPEALMRRTEHMLSAALKHGTTRMMAPHPRQVDPSQSQWDGGAQPWAHPLRWEPSNDEANLRALIETAHHNAAAFLRGTDGEGAVYSFPAKKFLTRDGREIAQSDLARISKQAGKGWRAQLAEPLGNPNVSLIGPTTVARSIIAGTLLRAEDSQLAKPLLADMNRRVQAGAAAPAQSLFYSLQEPEAAGAAADPRGFLDRLSGLVKPDNLSLREAVKAKLQDLTPAALGALTLRHIEDLGKKYLPQLTPYIDQLNRMQTDRNVLQEEGNELAEKWRTLQSKDRSGGRDTADLMHDATIEGVDPAEEYAPLTFTNLSREQVPITEAALKDHIKRVRAQFKLMPGESKKAKLEEIKDLRAKLAAEKRRRRSYPELVARWGRLSPEWQALYRKSRDMYSKRSAQTLEALVARIGELDAPDDKKRATAAEIRLMFEQAKASGPYFPLQRFGSYWVAAKNPDTGKRDFFMFESAADQLAALRDLKVQGYQSISSGKKLEQARDVFGASEGFVTEIQRKLGAAGAPSDLQDEIWQLYLRTLPDLSQRKHFIHRKKVAGYNPDALRAFAANMNHSAYQVARLRYGHRMQNLVGEAKKWADSSSESDQGNAAAMFYNEFVKRHDWVMNPQDSALVNKVSGLGFFWYLGVTPGAALVNLTQTAIVAGPVLASRFGAAKAMNALSRGMRDSIKTGGNIERTLRDEELAAYQAMRASGAIDKTQAHNLAGIAEVDSAQYSDTWHRVMRGVSALFHKAEVVNREATGMAAYRLAREQGMGFSAAVQYAENIIWESHFDYSNANRARFMQSGAAKVLLMFRQYSLSMSYFLWRNFYQTFKGESQAVRTEARRKLTGVLGMTAVFSGALGMPLMSVVFGVANAMAAALGDDDDPPFDAEAEFRNFLADLMGADVARLIARGPVNFVTGADIASRVTLDGLWLREPERELEGKALANYWLEQAAGPIGGIFVNAMQGLSLMHQGEAMRGVEAMTPKFIKDGLRSLRYVTEGVNTLRGDALIEDLSPTQAVLQLAGLTPAAIGERYDANNAIKRFEEGVLRRRQRLLDGFAMSVRLEDDRLRDTTLQHIRAFNQANPEIPIDAKSIRASLQARLRYSERSLGGIAVNPRIEQRAREQGRFAEN